jgi:hypothetical protein
MSRQSAGRLATCGIKHLIYDFVIYVNIRPTLSSICAM